MRKFLVIIVLFVYVVFSAKSQFILQSDTIISIKNIGDVVIPEHSKIISDSLGNIIAFYPASAITIGDFTVKPNSLVELYPQGSLKRLIPLQDHRFTIHGLQIIAPAQFPVTFYPNGQIDEIYLKNDFVWHYKGFKAVFKAGSYLKFHNNGQLKMGLLKLPAQVRVGNQQVILKPERPVIFYPDGQFKGGFVLIPVSLIDVHGQKVKIERNRFIEIDKKGKLLR